MNRATEVPGETEGHQSASNGKNSGAAKHVVLLGIGHTNADVVKQWIRDPVEGCRLICISKFPDATYSGMLPGTLGWQFRDDEMRIDLEALTRRAGAELVLAETNGLDLDAGQLTFADRDPIRFDVLSIGVGSMPVGWQRHIDSPMVVPIKPMQTFLQRLNARLAVSDPDGDRPLRVAIVGGGVAGVEIAFCLHQQCRKRAPNRAIDLQIFTASPRVADGMKDRSIGRLERLLTQRGISVASGHRVVEVGQDDVVTDDGRRHPVDCVIWATGASAPAVLGTLGLETDRRGFIATSDTLQSLSDDRIFAVGDSGTVMDSPSPKAGVYAVRQCPILWHNLRARLSGAPLQTFQPQRDFLKLLNTGDGKALLEYGPLTCHGRWCWSLKTWIDKRFIREFQCEAPSPGCDS